MAEYRTLVDTHLKDLDIGYLALNAGVGGGAKSFVEQNDESVDNIMALNCLHVVYLAKALLG